MRGSEVPAMLSAKHGAPMKQVLSLIGLGLLMLAGVIYMAGSASVGFAWFREWTGSLGTWAGVVVVILFLIGGVFVQVFIYLPTSRKGE
jgi:FtsH-binding integral membrane protein